MSATPHPFIDSIDPEPERTFRVRRRAQRAHRQISLLEVEEMEDLGSVNGNDGVGGPARIENPPVINDNDRSMMEIIIPVLDELDPSIAQPVNGVPFKLEPVMFTMLQNMGQFHGLLMEDPHKHLRNFIEVANTFRNPNILDDVLRLKFFPHSLADKAKEWLNSLPSNSITNWHTLAEKFIMKFFPSNKIVQTRGDIANFMQRDGETLVDVWERALADSAANGMFMTMSFNQAHELLEQMTQNYAQWPEERNQPRRVAGLHEINPVTALSAKFDALSNLVRTQEQTIEARLSQPQVPLPTPQIPVTQPQVNQPFAQPSELPIAPPSSLEALLREYLVKNETKQNSLEAVVQSIPASLRNIESQLGHLANTMNTRPPGTLPCNTEEPRRNKEQCNMIDLRNGRSLNQPEAVVRPSTLKKKEKMRTCRKLPSKVTKTEARTQFRKFLDLLKQLHVNIPFMDALEQMPTYVKFMKEILSRKRRLEEFETVALTQESSQYLL
ncbi:uncharacterized protein LOC133285727, partial [Gastrolobium bilobum]|uniref:uncharacterized protein LOC133285727 n=1 Tax=Gastrolobium bilobum TaxID=150636 RepID=UPI002AB2ED58